MLILLKITKISFMIFLKLIAQIPGVERIRYTSPHPQDITDELLKIMHKFKNICNYIHLPLQAGSDRILKRMHRSYSKKDFLNLVKKIRYMLPNVGISTDIIVGFPGETEKDFFETIEVMKEVRFDSAFNFKYSPRVGTKASEFEDQISEKVKQKRLEKVINLQKKHSIQRNQLLIGSIQDVLVEKQSKMSSKCWAGRTDSNKWVIFQKETVKVNDMVKVLITDSKGISLKGKTNKGGKVSMMKLFKTFLLILITLFLIYFLSMNNAKVDIDLLFKKFDEVSISMVMFGFYL